MDFTIAPATGVSSVQASGQTAPALVLTPGEVIDAQVVQILNDGRARLALPDGVIDVATQVDLTPGATVRLAVTASNGGLTLAILNQTTPATAATPTTPAVQTAAPQPGPTTVTLAHPAAPDPSIPVAAAQPAPGRPATIAAPNLPANAAVGAASGADGLASHLQTPLSPPLPHAAAAQAAASAAALASAVQVSAARQSGLSPLFADAAVAANLASLPEPVRRALQQVLALRPALDQTMSADTVKQAFQRSGLFLEAHLAAEGAGAAPGGPPLADLKAALTVVRAVLGAWQDADGAAPQAAAPGAPIHAASPDDHAASPPPPPPYRGAPPVAQPAVPPWIAKDSPPEMIRRALISEVDGVLSRQTLLQAASLPDQSDNGPRLDATRWNFEVPFAMPQGTAIAQFEIARDGGGNAASGAAPVWRVRFSLDVEPIGPVHAQVALIGARTAVTLWAERPDTSARLRDNSGRLADALRAAELETGDVLVRDGTPPRPRDAAPSGRFLDRAS